MGTSSSLQQNFTPPPSFQQNYAGTAAGNPGMAAPFGHYVQYQSPPYYQVPA